MKSTRLIIPALSLARPPYSWPKANPNPFHPSPAGHSRAARTGATGTDSGSGHPAAGRRARAARTGHPRRTNSGSCAACSYSGYPCYRTRRHRCACSTGLRSFHWCWLGEWHPRRCPWPRHDLQLTCVSI